MDFLKFAADNARKEFPVKKVDQATVIGLRIATEFGFRCAEKGWNIERTMLEFDKLQDPAYAAYLTSPIDP